MEAPVIEVECLSRRFNGFIAVDKVSFSVKPGEIFGFLGPNGAGKTTTIRMLCTLLAPTSGAARVGGFDVVRAPSEVRRTIGIVFQDPSLDDRLTARENLAFHAIIYRVPSALREERIRQALVLVGLEHRAHDLVRTFSGGMKRRLEIARGFLHRPQILFLDEPTLGLDPQTRSRIWEFLTQLRKQEGLTLFLTTHYMDEAERCDRIAIIDHGRMAALDTPAALKHAVQNEVIDFQTSAPEELRQELLETFQIPAVTENGRVRLEVGDGGAFLARVLPQLKTRLTSLQVRKPTLDDVFIRLTGHAIRESDADVHDPMRMVVRRRQRVE